MGQDLQVGVLLWSITIGLIVVLLAVDLLVAAVRPHHVGYREAALWSIFYIAVAVGYGSMSWPRVRSAATSSALQSAMPVRTGGNGLNHAIRMKRL